MIDRGAHRPTVLSLCELAGDLAILTRLLDGSGVDVRPMVDEASARDLLDRDGIDLVLADSGANTAVLARLFEMIDARPAGADLPIVLLARPDELPRWSELTSRRFNVVLLAKPTGAQQLATAIGSGLKLRARQAEVRRLIDELSAANDRLAQANAELEQGREEAAAEARRKTRFLAAISHDIRTPVNALVLSCHLLRSIGQGQPSISSADVDELTEALLSNASSLVELVNDLLDISRHDQGKLEFIETEFAADDFLRATIDGLRPLAEEKGLALTCRIDRPGARLRTDRVKLARVVQNLVANAIKFTDLGEVCVEAEASPRRGFRLTVRDTGVGIPEAMRELIFDEFSQLRNPERDRTKGTGLGLAICRRLMGVLGGSIRVASPPGQSGSTFLVTLPGDRVVALDGPKPAEPRPPARPGVDPPAASPPSATSPSTGSRGTVLLVEDHAPSRTMLCRLLRRAGFDVEEAENGRVALGRLSGHRPDLVLMDLMMPEMGGAETLEALRAEPLTRDLPVVILTGDVGDNNLDRLGAIGASGFLSKPIEFEALSGLIDRLLPAREPARKP